MPVHQQDTQAAESCQDCGANEETFSHLVVISFSEFQQPCLPIRPRPDSNLCWCRTLRAFQPATPPGQKSKGQAWGSAVGASLFSPTPASGSPYTALRFQSDPA